MTNAQTFSIAIHGGAGNYNWTSFSEVKKKLYASGLKEALAVGAQILQNGGNAMNAGCAAVESMENNPIFNAGKGAVFTKKGIIEMDATVMCGKTLQVGAVAGIRHIKNPVRLAKALMEWGKHNFMYGSDAEALARQFGEIDFVPTTYFETALRKNQLAQALTSNQAFLDHNLSQNEKSEKGTVGAVAKDMHGNLAAATSTGGMTAKHNGRIGDSAVIGAGTFAKNGFAAVSCTGTGEAFIRIQAASRVIHMMEFGNRSLQAAAHEVIQKDLLSVEGSGGLIAVDADGNIALPFNSTGMFRAWIDKNGQPRIETAG